MSISTLPYLIIALGVPAYVLPVIATVLSLRRDRTLGLVALSYLSISLCLAAVLLFNTVADVSTLIDCVHGWFLGAVGLIVWSTFFSAIAVVRALRRR